MMIGKCFEEDDVDLEIIIHREKMKLTLGASLYKSQFVRIICIRLLSLEQR